MSIVQYIKNIVRLIFVKSIMFFVKKKESMYTQKKNINFIYIYIYIYILFINAR